MGWDAMDESVMTCHGDDELLEVFCLLEAQQAPLVTTRWRGRSLASFEKEKGEVRAPLCCSNTDATIIVVDGRTTHPRVPCSDNL
jgi:hypothetical protein